MSRLPIRLRLTLAFAVAMAAVLAAMAAFVYVRVSDALLASIDQGLRTQVTESTARLTSGKALTERDRGEGLTLAQQFDPNGNVVRTTAATGTAPLASSTLVASVARSRSRFVNVRVPGRTEDWRLLLQPIRVGGKPYVLGLARSLRPRETALHHVFHGFLIGGPLALLLASLAGYGLAAAALRPVEAMRRRAAAITAATPGRRLPVPRSHDEIFRLAETLNSMLTRLEEAFVHERRFVADASHELRTPLALLRTELELALRHRRTPAELEAALRSAAEETERLSRLAEDLLLIARADQGVLPLRRVEVSARDLFERVVGRFATRTRGLHVEANDERLDADPDRLEQALGNLVDNALAHGATPVTLAARVRNGLVELHVTDEGPGFAEEFLPRAFDRFSRADQARAHSGSGHAGTGLGLSIVELVAQAHGGTTGAANRLTGGADVWIAVPRAQRS